MSRDCPNRDCSLGFDGNWRRWQHDLYCKPWTEALCSERSMLYFGNDFHDSNVSSWRLPSRFSERVAVFFFISTLCSCSMSMQVVCGCAPCLVRWGFELVTPPFLVACSCSIGMHFVRGCASTFVCWEVGLNHTFFYSIHRHVVCVSLSRVVFF